MSKVLGSLFGVRVVVSEYMPPNAQPVEFQPGVWVMTRKDYEELNRLIDAAVGQEFSEPKSEES